MPIKGLDRGRFLRLGKVRTGIMVECPKKKGDLSPGRGPFVVLEAVAKVYGEEPTILEPVLLPVEWELVFASTY